MRVLKNVWVILLLTLVVVLTFLYQEAFVNLFQLSKLIMKLEDRKSIILAWNTFFGEPIFSKAILQQLKCDVSQCIFSTDRLLANSSDALLFHWVDTNVHDIPKMKPWNQKWVLINFEPPFHTPEKLLSDFDKGALDWTVSYRLDSDFVSPYGQFHQRRYTDPAEHNITEEDFESKKIVAWMASNCNSQGGREDLVRKLQNYLQVDVYGKCAGKFESPYTSIKGSLYQGYKFYLAFENSLCTDYITEKSFYPLMVGMVPVVFGLANYTRFLPPGSFINALHFKTVSELSEHLSRLSSNFTLYKEYLKWRKGFVIDHGDVTRNYLCDLCLRLRENNESVTENRTRDMRSWWNVTRDCKEASKSV